MSPFATIADSPLGHALTAVWILLTFVQLFACILAFRQRRSHALKSGTVAHLLALTIVMSAFIDYTYHSHEAAFEALPKPLFITALASVPYGIYAVLASVSLVVTAVCLVNEMRFARRHVLSSTVKEAVDRLPVGVCFSNEGGTVLLANVVMDDLCQRIVGRPLGDARLLWDSVEKSTVAARLDDVDTRIVLLDGGEAWQFELGTVDSGRYGVRQLTAANVTEQFRLTQELEERNARLQGIHERMVAHGSKVESLAAAEAVLNARSVVHDEVGHVLLICRYYLEHPDRVDEGMLLEALRRTNGMFMDQEMEPPTLDGLLGDAYVEALMEAGRIGVQVAVEGSVPDDARVRSVIARGVRECATNAAKHAGASLLTLRVEQGNDLVLCTFTNDGEPPAGIVRETGGLVALRRTVEEAGGAMSVSSSPAFALTLSLPCAVQR